MTRVAPEATAAVDPALGLAMIAALAATFVAVWLYYYLPLTSASGRWFIRRTRRRLGESRRFLRVRHIGRMLWLIDASLVLSWRALIALYAAFLALFIVPILLTVVSLTLASAIVTP